MWPLALSMHLKSDRCHLRSNRFVYRSTRRQQRKPVLELLEDRLAQGGSGFPA